MSFVTQPRRGHPESRPAAGGRFERALSGVHRGDCQHAFIRWRSMSTNANFIHAMADVLIVTHGQNATEWLECGGRAAMDHGVAGWRAEIVEEAWLHRSEDVLVLRALRNIEHVVELVGGARIESRIRALVDEDWNGRWHGAMARIGEVFAHELLLGDTGEPFESIEYAFREHGEAVLGEEDEQPWKAAPALSGAEAPRRIVSRRGAIRRAPGPVPRPAGTVAPGEGDGGRGR